MATGDKIIGVIKEMNKPNSSSTDIVYGTVSSISPIKIKIDKLEIGSDFILLSNNVKKKTVKINGTDTILWEDLKVGEKVVMIRANQGQLYYVLDRG